jgi:hypothetical protein
MKTITLVFLSVVIAACATQQRAPATRADPNSVAPNVAVAASAPAGTTPAPAVPVADHSADNSNVAVQSALKHGYKAVHRNGQLLYCRSQILTGTHFQNTVCLTEAQMNASERERQEVLDQLSKSGGVDCRVYKCN